MILAGLPVWAWTLIGIVIAIILICLIILIWWIKASNKLKRFSIKVDESASGIDVALTKRFDLLTKEIEVVKGYAKFEAETLINVINARKGINPEELNLSEKEQYNEELNSLSKDINILVERYPDLKTNENYLSLQATLADCEETLQGARRVYNSNVSIFNQSIAVFPTSLVAKHMKLVDKLFFQAESSKRQDVKIDL